jgi:hypothetical protein
MKFKSIVTIAGMIALSITAFAMKSQTFQVSGPVVDLSATTVTLEKAKGERWVIARDAITRVLGGELKVGNQVTVSYVMAADNIVVKSGKTERASFAESGKGSTVDIEKPPAKIQSGGSDHGSESQ